MFRNKSISSNAPLYQAKQRGSRRYYPSAPLLLFSEFNFRWYNPYHRVVVVLRCEANFARIAEFVNFVADVVAQVGNVPFVCSKIEQVEHRARRRLHHHLAGAAARSHHLHAYLLREGREPHASSPLHDSQVIVEADVRKPRPRSFKQMPHGRIRVPRIVRKLKGCGLHGV